MFHAECLRLPFYLKLDLNALLAARRKRFLSEGISKRLGHRQHQEKGPHACVRMQTRRFSQSPREPAGLSTASCICCGSIEGY